MNYKEQSYAIWLLPEDTTFDLLSSMINKLAQRFDSSNFSPHATLCSGKWPDSIVDLKAKVDTIAEEASRPSLATTGIEYVNTEFQFFYIALSPNEIEPVFRCAKKELPSARFPKVGPHVSLIYSSDFESIDRRKLKNELVPFVPTTIQFGSLALVLPKDNKWDDVENWTEAHQSTFGA